MDKTTRYEVNIEIEGKTKTVEFEFIKDGDEYPDQENRPVSAYAIQTDDGVYYDSWFNQYRGPWLNAETMEESEIRSRIDEGWECGDYKEVINLMAELLCRRQPKKCQER